MKKAKKILCSALALIMIFSFSACSSKTEDPTTQIKDNVNAVEKGLFEFDLNEVLKYAKGDAVNNIKLVSKHSEDFEEIAKSVFYNLKITVEEVNIEEGKDIGDVTLKIKNRDFTNVITQYLGENMQGFINGDIDLTDEKVVEEQLKTVRKLINDCTETKESAVIVPVEKNKNGRWILLLSSEAEDALSGGTANIVNAIVKAYRDK